MSNSPYPLSWPPGRPRAKASTRVPGKFSSEPGGLRGKRPLTVAGAMDRLQAEVKRLGGTYPVISSNLTVRLDGTPRSGQPDPEDVGVALYFMLGGKPVCMPCDRYTRVADNIAAVAAHIAATRAIERYGVGTSAEALSAFMALPAPSAPRPWREVLGIPDFMIVDADTVRSCFVIKARQLHANDVAMAELNLAREAALKEMQANG